MTGPNIDNEENNIPDESVTTIFLFGKSSATLIIPAEIVRQCSLDGRVVIERKNGGIFIHKSNSEFESD